ncbi:hypothetical protein VAE151_500323 [Vibrio aestuarianus]|nr:hypothetical protein VIBAE_A10322 [Vibrio aestuarianus subsp. francensis]CAH8184383.1 hypothetical protein VAE032_220323 [Vibrio aestuarianus]CAH8184440.1 hypothetical protein VAE055_320323 [Vibrio aestuarianus]CAH8184517.1 hypothetical protein VAE128_420323 [Vibrio aestuarianus]CAH8184551.1 hypothetical protein VAE130_530322 [Vibrio aestuarianus]
MCYGLGYFKQHVGLGRLDRHSPPQTLPWLRDVIQFDSHSC